MSTASPPSPPNPTSVATSKRKTTAGASAPSADSLIRTRIAEAAASLWWAELTRRSLVAVITGLGLALCWAVADQWLFTLGTTARMVVGAAFMIAAVAYVYYRIYPLIGCEISPQYAARSLEHDLPDLRQSLTSYVMLSPKPGDSKSASPPALSDRVVRSIGVATASRLKKHDALPIEATGTLRWWVATAIMSLVIVVYAVVSPKNTLQSAARLVMPLASIDPPRRVSITDVVPGDAEAIAGRSTDVAANIRGMRSDETATIQWDVNGVSNGVDLQPDTEGGFLRHVGSIPLPHSASGVVEYRVVAGDATVGPFRLKVRDIPVVALQSVAYSPPKYTGQSDYTRSAGAITAIDGTRITIRAGVNRPVARATIQFNPRPLGEVVRATAGVAEMQIGEDGSMLTSSFQIKGARGRSSAVELDSYRIEVWDESGQSNPDPIIYPIRVIADLPPEVAIVMPVSTPKNVPINAQQIIEVHAADPDFALQDIRLEVRSGIDMIDQPVLWRISVDETGGSGNKIAEYRFRPGHKAIDGLGLSVGDTVEVVAIATDSRVIEGDATVEPNVTRTDPITLKIVASDALPPAGDPQNEGMSAPDDKPTTDANDKDGSFGDSDPQSGGGGSGGEGASKQQPGEGQSGGESSGDSGGNEGESSGEGGSGSGESESGENAGENPNPNGGSSGDQGGESGNDGGDDPGSGAMGGDASDEAGGKPGQSDPGQEGGGQPQDGGSPEGGQQDAGDRPESTSKPQDSNSEGDASSTDGSTDQGESVGDDSTGGKSGEEAGEGSPDGSSPEHDGEAFERIKEYLDQKQNQGQSSAGQNDASSQQGDQGDENGSDEKGAGEKGQGESGSGEKGSEERRAGEQGDGEQGAGGSDADPSSGQDGSNKGNPEAGQQGSGESGKQGDAPEQDGSAEGDAGEGMSDSSNDKSGDGSSGEAGGDQAGDSNPESGEPGREAGEEANDGKSGGGEPKPSSAGGAAQPQGDAAVDSGKPGSEAMPGTGSGGDGKGEDGDATLPPDPINTDYAKKATDLVLDYLEQTRDRPDADLLKRLNWTEADLQHFRDRWKDVRDMDPAGQRDGATGRELEESLRSLGLRQPSTDRGATTKDQADTMRGIRDSGNRKPPPAAYRDAFDAFRRSMGSQK
ncbi:hypothetical protein Poly51_29940 [Rubripirellula tenax]|uniref:Uncharacterized protein n=1 Tax=Rubripirellula tenax TaxID=2528015 RepID=A0A5C6F5U3_9BACT|nr:hypothetical protein [Rubripirellula tenax]TWU57073.1 hypothetical protein Poly51_29940 [Rubripirellula tenax]